MESEDISVEIIDKSPKGGMRVGVTPSAVRIVHTPTGIVAECGTARSQHRNRAICIAMIEAALEYGESSK